MPAPKDPKDYEAWRQKLRVARRKNLYRPVSLSVYMRPFIRQTIEEKMPVDKGLAFLDQKRAEYHKLHDKRE
jgi:hypothetical protein